MMQKFDKDFKENMFKGVKDEDKDKLEAGEMNSGYLSGFNSSISMQKHLISKEI